MKLPFSVITGKSVNHILSKNYVTVKNLVQEAYLLHKEGKAKNPDSYFFKRSEISPNRIIALPSYLGGRFNISGMKWIASHPDNVKLGIPRASAVIILNNPDTGYPLACIEGSIISATRTAASAILAAEYLSDSNNKEIGTIGFIGCGLISKYIFSHFIGNSWIFRNIKLFDKKTIEAEKLSNFFRSHGFKGNISIAQQVDELLDDCDMIVFATTATTPYITQLSNKRSTIILNISLRDIEPQIILESNNFVDNESHVMKANTSVHLAEQMTGNRKFISGDIVDLIQGKTKVDRSKHTIFSPFGLGVLDIALGYFVYTEAQKNSSSIPIDNFFHETDR